MIALLILASITRCASTELCPTDKDILQAVRARDEALATAHTVAAYQEDPDSFVHFSPQRIKGISEVICGDVLPGEARMITCKFTVRYWSSNAYHVARMLRMADGWQIDEALVVSRDRR